MGRDRRGEHVLLWKAGDVRPTARLKNHIFTTVDKINRDGLAGRVQVPLLRRRCPSLDDEKHSRVRLPESEDLLLERRVLDGIAARRRCTRLALGHS
jgi:hypothetical protein